MGDRRSNETIQTILFKVPVKDSRDMLKAENYRAELLGEGELVLNTILPAIDKAYMKCYEQNRGDLFIQSLEFKGSPDGPRRIDLVVKKVYSG